MNFTEAVTQQTNHMLAAARRLDEKGYIIFVHGVNRAGFATKHPYGYFNGAMLRFYNSYTDNTRHKTVVVQVHVPLGAPITAKPFDTDFFFTCDVPRSRHLRPIVAALELTSAKQKGRWTKLKPVGAGILLCTELSDRFEFSGRGRTALEIVIRVLEMPMHAKLLLRGKPDA